MSTFFGLNIGKTGLYAYKAALDTTAHNISNTESKGYTRQVINQRAGNALRVNNSYGMAGTGVLVSGIDQLRDEYYDIKFWKNSTLQGEYGYKGHYMNDIENYFNEVSVEGFTSAYDTMYTSIQELIKEPASQAVRSQVVNYATSLTEYFNSLSVNLKDTQEECNFEIKNMVDKTNSIAQQISALTRQINTLEVKGGKANDLRDQRALLVDDLSQIANISVTEKIVGDGIGISSYIVKIDNQTLVDSGEYNSLQVIPRKEKINQNDVEGLYDVAWANGQRFDLQSQSLGGALQALYEVRDGNNNYNLQGTIKVEADDPTIVSLSDTTINDVNRLNIPETGKLTIGHREYIYNGFEVTKGADGKFTYEFQLESPVIGDATGAEGSVGSSINYKGIPYYMGQMNQFVRTFAEAFNEIHRGGRDLNNEAAKDFFSAIDKVSGRNYTFGPLEDSDDYADYDFDSFNSATGKYYEQVSDNKPLYGSYYFMTVENFAVSDEIIYDWDKIATASDVINGIENNDIAEALLRLKTDKSLFKSGEPGGFMNTLVAEVGIDTKKAANFAESQDNILRAITNQRLSVSGVDIDEEAMNLIRFQNAYNLSAKVISVMDEIYDRLINHMGV